MTRRLAALAAVAVIFASCGSDFESGEVSATSTRATTTAIHPTPTVETPT